MRGQTSILTITCQATAAIKAQHFITFEGAHATATDVSNLTILGVAQADADAGSDLAVGTIGVLNVKTGGAISKGEQIVSDANGLAIPSSSDAFGIALHDAVAGGTVQILIR